MIRRSKPGQKNSSDRRINNERSRSLDFQKYAAEGNHFLNEVADELGVSKNTAGRIIKAVFHAVRDRMPADDAVQFGQGLPMALKAVYFDQWDISDNPVVLRRAHDFLDYIYYKNEFGAAIDFPDEDSVENALSGVFSVLQDYMDAGQIEQAKMIMGDTITELIEGDLYYDRRNPVPV